MTWKEKIKMAKGADPTLSDEKAAEVVNDLTQLAHLAVDCYMNEKRMGSDEQVHEKQRH